jgi:sugar transferase (PEP-CTERM/EpsH1 system associated)
VKILFVCHRFPYPPTQGGNIRSFNMIRHLSRHASVTVASIVHSQAEADAGAGIEPYCDNYKAFVVPEWRAWLQMILRVPSPIPSSLGYFASAHLRRFIAKEAATGGYDMAFVHCSSVAPYVAGFHGLPKLLDFADMDSAKWALYADARPFPLSFVYGLEAWKLRRLEASLAADFDLSTCTTAAELETLDELGTAPATGWFPNGVDIEFFQPTPEPWDPDLICFTGRMDYFPNQQGVSWFAREVLPLVQAQRPAARFTAVGAAPPAAIRKLAELPGVTVTGTVPDVRPFTQRAAVSVAPLFLARGVQNKVLESMAMGVPVVSSLPAARGVDAVPGEHLLTAEGPPEFARAVLSLMADTARRDQLARAGRERVLSHHTWARAMQVMDELLANRFPDRWPQQSATDLASAVV